VLDAERSLFDSEMSLASARSDRLAAIVNVCVSLGGGWKDGGMQAEELFFPRRQRGKHWTKLYWTCRNQWWPCNAA